MATDDRFEYRARRSAFLDRFAPKGETEAFGEALTGVTTALLEEARYQASWPVATAEKWRYDRMMWVFGVMLGEIPADSHAPSAEDYDDYGRPTAARTDLTATTDDEERDHG